MPPPRLVFGVKAASGFISTSTSAATNISRPLIAAVAARSAARAFTLAEVNVLARAARWLVDLLLPPL